MATTQTLAPHEALELHEVLRTATLATTKIRAMLPLVTDAELKGIMQQCLQNKQNCIAQARQFVQSGGH